MKIVIIDYLSDRSVIKCIQTVNKNYKVKFSIRSEIGIVTGGDQWDRKKTIIKTRSAGKIKDRRETNTTIN